MADLGISRGLLTARLDTLTEGGVVEAIEYQQNPVRHEYMLTTAGRELVPGLLSLTAWGDRWRGPDGRPIVARHRCGSSAAPAIVCADCGQPLAADDMTYAAGPGGRQARGTMLVAELLTGGAVR